MAHGISINHQSLWIQYISAKFAEAQFTDSWVQLFSCACVFVENSFSLAAFYGLLPCPWARVREHKRIIYSTSSRACVVPCSLPLCHNIRCVSWHAAGSLRALSLCIFLLLFWYYNGRLSVGPLTLGPRMEVRISFWWMHLLDNMIMRADRYDQEVLISMWNMAYPQPAISLKRMTTISNKFHITENKLWFLDW